MAALSLADAELEPGSHVAAGSTGHGLIAPAPLATPATRGDAFNAGPTGHEGIELAAFANVLGVDRRTAAAIYFGNWQRDVSQFLAPMVGVKAPALGPLLFELLDIKAEARFGRRLRRDRLGVYRWEEHLDNPRQYGVALDPASYGPVAVPTEVEAPEDSRFQLSLWREDPTTALPRYYLVSRRYVLEQLARALRAGPGPDGFELVGNALHVIEDHFAHSNFVELALGRFDPRVDPMTGRHVEGGQPIADLRGRWRLTTGVFLLADTAQSITKFILESIEGPPGPPTEAQDAVLRVLIRRSLGDAALATYDSIVRPWRAARDRIFGALGITQLQTAFDQLVKRPLRAALASGLHPLLELQARATTGQTPFQTFVANRPTTVIEPSHSLLAKDDPHRPNHRLARQLAIVAVRDVWQEVAAGFSRGRGTDIGATQLPAIVARIMCHPADSQWWLPVVRGETAAPSPVPATAGPSPRPVAPSSPRPAPSAAPARAYGYGYDRTGTACTGGAQPGARALLDYCLARWPTLRSGGIYNCRPVRGRTALSMHGEGRAIDLMVPSASAPVGSEVADWLVTNAPLLGVQEVIWDRRIWVASRRTQGWQPYGGVSPHTDHVHVGLVWRAARGPQALTLAYLRTLPAGGPAGIAPPRALPDTVRRGSRGPAVVELQRRLNIWAARAGQPGRLRTDGMLGPLTDAAVRAFQRSFLLAADGVVGPKTWTALAAFR